MNKQEYAIKVLNDIKHHYQLQAHGFQMSLDMGIKAIESQRWVPVMERYPEPKDEYKKFLVTNDLGEVSTATFYITVDDSHMPYFSGRYVTAWMPLPEPYKGGKADADING